MKKKILLLPLLVCSSLTGCRDNGSGTKIDTNKTQLYIMYIDQGFAGDWIGKLCTRFEERYKDVSFQAGKKGVQVIPNGTGDINLLPAVSSKGDESVFFVENYNATFYQGQDLTKTGAADLTDVLSKKLNESIGTDVEGNPIPAASDENVSVLEKFREVEKDYYFVEKNDGKNHVFGVPYIDCYRGTLSYDEDLFNSKELFFDEDNVLCASKSKGDKLGTGPDGVSGTADDGLPRTYAEFFELCNAFCDVNVAPITFAGNWSGYLQDLMFSLRAQSAGYEQTKSYYEGEGKVFDYITEAPADLNEAVGQEKTFDADSFETIFSTISEYAPIEFMYRLVKNQVKDPGHQYFLGASNFNTSYTHKNAQADLILTKQFNATRKDVGMLIDGTWWWNEAKEAIKKYSNRSGKDANLSRNIKYMALPKANEFVFNKTLGENVVFSDYDTAIVEKNNLTGYKKTLSDLFIRFCCTNESLVEWNLSVQCPRGLSYTLSDEDFSKLSVYGKSIYNVHNQFESENADENYSTYKVALNHSNSDFYKSHTTYFTVEEAFSAGDYLDNYVTAKGFYTDTGDQKDPRTYFVKLLNKFKND